MILDDNIGSKWDGTDVPSWLQERYNQFAIEETSWMFESYLGSTAYDVYRFSHEGKLYAALSYERFSFGNGQGYYHTTGTLCYTDDGRRVNFDKVKDSFSQNATLLWTNRWEDGNTPQVSGFGITDAEAPEWLQTVIDNSCKSVVEPGKLLSRIYCGYAHDDAETIYILFYYEYYDKNNLNGEIKISNTYTLSGEKVDTIEHITVDKLYMQSLQDLPQ